MISSGTSPTVLSDRLVGVGVYMVYAGIARGLRLEAAFFQQRIDEFVESGAEHDEQRHADEHARKAHKPVCDYDGKHHPEAADAHAAAE